MRRTANTLAVAAVLLADPDSRHYGYDLRKRSGVRSGRLYPMLSRMLAEKWLTDGWEDPATLADRRPPRRYYQLTADGRTQLAEFLEGAKR
jgi:PadR family transcriptional regulator PadR